MIEERSETPLGAGIIGLGVGEQHAAGFETHPDCRVVALCDVAPAKRAIARERWPGARIYERAEALIDDPGVQIVSIASYDDAHYGQLCRAIDAGKHAFVEKPICTTEEELADLRARLGRRPELHVSSNLILRKAPRFADLKARVERGALGRVYYLEGDYDYGRLHKLDGTWRGTTPGYSVVLGGAVHLVDLLLWLMAGRTPVEAMAMGNRISSAEARLSFAQSDLVAALVRFDDGAIAKISANFGCVRPHFHRVSVYGTLGTFENGPDDGRYWSQHDPGIQPERASLPYPGAAKGDLIPGFVDAILGRARGEITKAEILSCMTVCMAIERASRTGRPVAIGKN
jgi:predicted dehydrogenase